eukprot:scaffold25495_cov30-Tisochrysis_lutea.AAC.1
MSFSLKESDGEWVIQGSSSKSKVAFRRQWLIDWNLEFRSFAFIWYLGKGSASLQLVHQLSTPPLVTQVPGEGPSCSVLTLSRNSPTNGSARMWPRRGSS